jgi:hypothetical protein
LSQAVVLHSAPAAVKAQFSGMYRRKPNEGLDDVAKCPSSPPARSSVKPQGKATITYKNRCVDRVTEVASISVELCGNVTLDLEIECRRY